MPKACPRSVGVNVYLSRHNRNLEVSEILSLPVSSDTGEYDFFKKMVRQIPAECYVSVISAMFYVSKMKLHMVNTTD